MEIDEPKVRKDTGGKPGTKEVAARLQLRPVLSEESSHWNALLEKVASDEDRRAFQGLFQHFAPLIKAFAYKVPSVSQTEAFADELVQETMLKVWVKADSFDATRASASTWIFTIARN